MKRIVSLEEVDLGDKFTVFIDFEGARRQSDPGPTTTTKHITTTHDILTTSLDDIFHTTPYSTALSSRISSLGSEAASPVTPAASQSPSLDGAYLEVIDHRPTTPTKATDHTVRTSPNGRLIRRSPSPVSEPTSSLRKPLPTCPCSNCSPPDHFLANIILSHPTISPHSPSSRRIRPSLLIASTNSVQQPDPDEETTRIAIGLAGIDLDDDHSPHRLTLVPT